MNSTWGSRIALGLALLALLPVDAAAQRARELGLHAVFTAQDPELAAAGAYGGIRLTRRSRFAATAAAGSASGEFVFRGELLGHFLLSPASDGVGFYGGGGIAGVAGPENVGYLVLLLGLEHAPGKPSGWYLEGGLGGGVRIAAGYRWRRFSGRTPGR